MFEAVEFVEFKDEPGSPVHERQLGTFPNEGDAVSAARGAKKVFSDSSVEDYAWWIVRQPGARLARWIADSRSGKEYVLDLTSGQLVEVG
jgi:hypothetical protein